MRSSSSLHLAARAGAAADRTILGQRLTITNPDPSDPARRRLVVDRARAPQQRRPDRRSDGRRLCRRRHPAARHRGRHAEQRRCSRLPQGTSATGKPFWKAVNGGFRYADPRGENGPVASLVIRKAQNGTLSLRAVRHRQARAARGGAARTPARRRTPCSRCRAVTATASPTGPPRTFADDGARSFRVFRVASEGCPASVSGDFLALTYNVAGLPEGISELAPRDQHAADQPAAERLRHGAGAGELADPGSEPARADCASTTRSWSPTPTTRTSRSPAPQPLGTDPLRPSALLADGLNRMARFPFADVIRTRWSGCHQTAADCLAHQGLQRRAHDLRARRRGRRLQPAHGGGRRPRGRRPARRRHHAAARLHEHLLGRPRGDRRRRLQPAHRRRARQDAVRAPARRGGSAPTSAPRRPARATAGSTSSPSAAPAASPSRRCRGTSRPTSSSMRSASS